MNPKGMHAKSSDCGDSSENGDVVCEYATPNGAVASGSKDRVAALKEKNRERLALKKLTGFDEEVVRVVGQHLNKLGLRSVLRGIHFLETQFKSNFLMTKLVFK